MSKLTEKWGNWWHATKDAAVETTEVAWEGTKRTAANVRDYTKDVVASFSREDEKSIEVIMAIKQCPREDAIAYLEEYKRTKEAEIAELKKKQEEESTRAIMEKQIKGDY